MKHKMKKGQQVMKKRDYDFSGYATKNDLLCSDGRVIRKDAFKDCDGKVVPLVWNHGGRTDPSEIIGHALLENKDDGVYAYGYFNDSEKAQTVKRCVDHGDITGLSIYANSLKQRSNEVLHGLIRELSLVLVGANPGATIDFVMQHDGESLDSFYYYLNGDDCEFQNTSFEVAHADNNESEERDDKDMGEETEVEKVLKGMSKEKKEAVLTLIAAALVQEGLVEEEEVAHADNEAEDGDEVREKTLAVLDALTDEQKAAVLALVETVVDDAKERASVKHADDEDDEEYEEEEEDHDEDEEESDNLFDNLTDEQIEDVMNYAESLANGTDDTEEELKEGANMKNNAFEHSDTAIKDAYVGLVETAVADLARTKRGTLTEAVIRHADEYGFSEDSLQHSYPTNEFGQQVTYGISDIHYLFPDAKAVGEPEFVQRNQEWVSEFLGSTRHSPFARTKSLYFDITADEARAKGYVKGTKKVEEVIVLLKRKTDPYTIYKKQKLDRDDKLDIANSFDVVKMMRAELSVMLDEEVARAGMIGDGRSPADPDKIPELNIRPIYTDDAVYSIKVTVVVPSDATDDEIGKLVIREIIKRRKDYKGSGNPKFFINPTYLSNMLLIEDGIGRSLYPTRNELSSRLLVSKLVETPVFENVTRTSGNKTLKLVGIILNPIDYTYGTDRGGEKTMFDGFDIDYNQEKYLLETRCSGALTKPYSAMVVEIDASGDPIHSNSDNG